MKKRHLLLIPLLLLLVSNALANQAPAADGFGYMWTDTVSTPHIDFEWIDIKGEGSIFGSDFDDIVSSGITLPFSFYFYGTQRTTIYISSNGWASFIDPGTESYPTNGPIPSASGQDAMIAPFWYDLASTPGNNGGVYYKSEGTAPNRRFIMQWHILNGTGPDEIEFEVILFEHSNLIKFQYKTVDPAYGGGSSASIGIKSTSSLGIQYTPSILASSAILFHSSSLNAVSASIAPSTVQIDDYVTFNYRINNLTGPTRLGKADHLTLTNPFSSMPVVTGIKINQDWAFVLNSTSKPSQPGFATWSYSGGTLTVQTSHFDVIDSIRITFVQSIPGITAGSYNYNSTADADLNITPARSPSPQPSVTVQAGDLYKIVIQTTPGDGGTEFDTHTMNASETVDLYAAGYDEYDNYLGPQIVQWLTTGSLDDTTASGNSFTFDPVKAPTSGTIQASSGGFNDATGTITVGVGPLAHIRINSSPGEAGEEVGDVDLITGQSITLYATGYDSDDNYLGAVIASWDETGTLDPVGGSGDSYTFTPSTPSTSGTIEASSGGFSDETGAIAVTAGTLDHIVIQTTPGDGGPEFDTHTMNASQSVTMYAAGYNENNNYLGEVNVNWLSTGTLDVINANGSSFTFNPVKAPASGTIIARSGTISDFTGTITVNLGPLHHIKIIYSQDANGQEVDDVGLTAGQFITLYAAGYDIDDNYRGPVTATWSRTGDLDPVSGSGPSYNFTPTTAPTSGTIRALSGGFEDFTGTIEVVAGIPHHVIIRTLPDGGGVEFDTHTMSADQSVTMYAAVYDASNNFLGNLTANWVSTGSLDIINASGPSYAFHPVKAPSLGRFIATVSGLSDQTGDIEVSVGNLHHIKINNDNGQEIDELEITVGESRDFYSDGYDYDDNYIGPVSASWSSTGGLDDVDETGTSFTFTPTTAPSAGTIQANYLSFSDVTGTISVFVGDPHHITIRTAPDGGGIEFDAHTLRADQSVSLYAAAYDVENNFLYNITVDWYSTGSLDVINASGSSYTFNPVIAPANGYIIARAGSLSDITGLITVNLGLLHHIRINSSAGPTGQEVNDVDLTAGYSLEMYAASYDSDDNYISLVNAEWSSTGTLDPVDATAQSYTFIPSTAPSTGTIEINFGALTDPTGTINVYFGILHHIIIQTTPGDGGAPFGDHTMTADESVDMFAAGYDANYNYLGPITCNWVSTGSLDDINANGSSYNFSPVRAFAQGTIIATSGGISDATGLITVNLGELHHIRINSSADANGQEVGDLTLTTGQSITLYSAGYDSDDNFRGLVSSTWSRTGDLDPVIGSGTSYTFTPITANTSGTIRANSSGFIDETGDISISVSVLAYILIRDAPLGAGNEVGDLPLVTADDSIILYAAGYDASDNYLGPFSATWASTGSLDEVSATGTQFTFNPITAPRSGQIFATVGNFVDYTGTITVSVGALHHISINDAPGATGTPVGAVQLVAGQDLDLYCSGYDSDNNYIQAYTATWDQTGTLDDVAGSASSYTFTPITGGTSGTITATYLTFNAATGLIEVEADILHHIVIQTTPGDGGAPFGDHAMTADQSVTLYAAKYDASNNYLGPINVSWTSSGSLDVINATGESYIFNPVQAPASGTIVATSGDFSDATGTITVTVGVLHHISINNASGPGGVPINEHSMTTDQTLTLYCAGYDQDNNYISLVSATWSRTGNLNPVGGASTTITFSPSTAPTSGTIVATSGTMQDATGTITVSPGTFHHILITYTPGGIEVGDYDMDVGESLLLYASEYDSENNYRDVLRSVSWSRIGTLDPVSGTNDRYTFSPFLANTTGSIIATSGLYTDTTGTITVGPGQIASIKIRNAPEGAGEEFGSDSITADDSVTLYAAGYDAGENYVTDVVATWSRTGNLDPVSGTGTSYTFNPVTAPRTGTIVATYGGLNDATGIINVIAGLPVQLSDPLGTGQRTTIAGSGQLIQALVRDQHGNPIPNVSVSFSPSLRMSPATDLTNENGIAESIFDSPRDQNMSTVTAEVSGLSPLIFTIYGIRYVAPSLDPPVVQRGRAVTFSIKVSNPGNVAVPLNVSSSNISFTDGTYTYTAVLASPTVLPANSAEISLTFASATIHSNFRGDTYTPEIRLVGSGDFDNLNGSIYTNPGELTVGDTDITLGTIQVIGLQGLNQVLQGDQGIEASVIVVNSGIPLPIDPFPTTTLEFRNHSTGVLQPVSNLQRIDTLTVLKRNVPNEFKFRFDIPSSYQPGEIDVYFILSLNNGNLVKRHSPPNRGGFFYVLSSGNANYVAQSLDPDTVVPNQVVNFKASFANTGTANIVLDPSLSYIQILGPSIGPRYLTGQFTLTGGQTTNVTYNSMNMPSSISPAVYHLRWRLRGTLVNQQTFDTTATILNGLRVVSPAGLVFKNITIPKETVLQGESGVIINYTIRNEGQSPGEITDLATHFTKDGSPYPDNQWLETNMSPELPFTINPGQEQLFHVTYTLLQSAETGLIVPAPIVSYHDIRTVSNPLTSGFIQANDTVTVIKPAYVSIQNFKIEKDAAAPNAPNINVNQLFHLTVVVNNDGEDDIARVLVNIHRDSTGSPIAKTVQIDDIERKSSKSLTFNHSDSIAGGVTYLAAIDYAISDQGDTVTVGPPSDNFEILTIQTPRHLEFDAVIASRAGEVDSLIVSQDQIFTVQVNIGEQGTSSIEGGSLKLLLPDSLFDWENLDDSVQTFTLTPQADKVEWRIKATGISLPEQYDKFSFSIQEMPMDINTGLDVSHEILNDSVFVTVQEKGMITQNLISITDPSGAGDGIVSTGQLFNLRASIAFNATMEDTGRYAQIISPTDYHILSDSVVALEGGSSTKIVNWSIQAPDQAVPLNNISVSVSGYDKNSGDPVESESNIFNIQTVNKAHLSLDLYIEKLDGAASDTLSLDQSFDLVAKIQNEGTAGTKGNGRVFLQGIYENPAITYDSDRTPPIQIEDTLTFSGDTTLHWSLKVHQLPQESKSEQPIHQELSALLKILRGDAAISGQALAKAPSLTEKNDIIKQILEINAILASVPTDLTVRFLKLPLDENTDHTAFIPDTSKTKTLTIQEKANIGITQTIAPDTVSTGQTFAYKVKGNLSENLDQPMAHLALPESWNMEPMEMSLSGDSATFNIQVPTTPNYKGAPVESLTVLLSGIDRNSGEPNIASQPVYDTLMVQIKPELYLSSIITKPSSAQDSKRLSYGQILIIDVMPTLVEQDSPLEYADITDTGSVYLNPEIFTVYGFETIPGKTYEKTFTEINQHLLFSVRAPSRDITASLKFNFNRLPRDKNSGDFADVRADRLPLVIPISVVQKQIMVSMIGDLITNTTFTRGQGEHVLMAFSISNEGNKNPLYMNEVELTFIQGNDTTLLTNNRVYNLIDSIKIMNYIQAEEKLNRPLNGQETSDYAYYKLTESDSLNPLTIPIEPPFTIDSAVVDTFIIVAKFRSSAVSLSFRTILSGVNAYEEEPEYPVAIVDAEGRKLVNNPYFESQIYSVISGDMKEAFATYPNPFGRPPDEFAKIRFFLTETADVKLQIFTLVGDLVKSQWDRNLTNLPGGLYDNYIRWDGRNDKGHRVLNGVYLCAIEIKSGSSTKRFVTKIAYIK